jgi:hypothetical protein
MTDEILDNISKKINKFGTTKIIHKFKTQKLTLREKVSFAYPYKNTFGNPFVQFSKYRVKIIGNTKVQLIYKSTFEIQVSCRNECTFLERVLSSKLYKYLITNCNMLPNKLKYPDYSKFHNHSDINIFLQNYFHFKDNELFL